MKRSILQLLPTPYPLDREAFGDAYSSTNPTGDYKAALRLVGLVDPIPQMTPFYQASSGSVQSAYGNVIENAHAESVGSFVAGLLSTAGRTFSDSTLAGLGPTPSPWHAVDAVPSDWTRPSALGFREATIHTSTGEVTGLPTAFVQLGRGARLGLSVGGLPRDLPAEEAPDAITLKILQVDVHRPWYDEAVIQTAGWSLNGQRAGYLSSGSLRRNDGVLPLLPTGFLVGMAPQVEVPLNPSTASLVESAGEVPISLGPIPLTVGPGDASLVSDAAPATSTDPPLYLIGIISVLVPWSPQTPG